MSSIKASADNRNVTIAVGHHAADLSANACSTAAVAAATTATPASPAAVASPAPAPTGRHNVSVTNIKCEVDELMVSPPPPMEPPSPSPNVAVLGGFYHDSGGGIGIRIPVPKAELHDSAEDDSETELTNIENSVSVTRRVSASTAGLSNGAAHPHAGHKNGPRPMSWEGELSDTETNMTDEIMDTGEGEHRQGPSSPSGKTRSDSPGKVTVKKPEEISALPPKIHAEPSPVAGRLAGPIKPDLEMEVSLSQVAAGVGTLYTSPHPPTKLKLGPTQSDPINLKYEPADAAANSPLMARQKSITNLPPLPANPSPDSAIHSVYTHSSPSQSPLTSRHAPYTPSLSRNNSDASHSSCYSYSSEFSPTHSPIQGRHAVPPPPSGGASSLYTSFNGSSASLHHVSQSVLYRPISGEGGAAAEAQNLSMDTQSPLNMSTLGPAGAADGLPSSAAGISRQQLINSPCPICGDKISGFHYGIFSCESCKGFFKRTVQNRKNYVCVRGGPCPVSIATRKKCPACRFEKCLQKGMKLEAIREDRTRGGRSTYQCSYTLPNSLLSPLLSPEQAQGGNGGSPAGQHQPSRLGISSSLGGGGPSSALNNSMHHHGHSGANGYAASGGGSSQIVKLEKYVPDMHIGARGPPDTSSVHEASANGAQRGCSGNTHGSSTAASPPRGVSIPTLLQEIMDVEHLWQYNEAELSRLNQPTTGASGPGGGPSASQMTNPLLASAGLSSGDNANPDLIAHLCNVADHRLYKIVKWCKSLPLFKNISIDDQICLLINSWCELLLFSCCFRSIDTPGEIKMSQGKKISLSMAKSSGLQSCIERMLNLTDHLRRLRVDRYEYVAMKVIVLLQSDTSELREPVRVRECQEKALQSLQSYTLSHYPDVPSKFGELLLRIPDLQRTCQLGKEMLTIKSRDGGDFNLLMELLRGEH